jgi:hypothetical protein
MTFRRSCPTSLPERVTPASSDTPLDSFTFKVSDGSLDSNVATVTVTTNGLSKRLTTTPRW